MRNCPQCGFSNGEEFATCVWCNRSLADTEWTPPIEAGHPDHEKLEQQQNRGRMLRRQLVEAVALYSLVITFFTLSGLLYTWHSGLLLCSMAGSIATGTAVARRWVGQLTAPILQAGLSTIIAVYFGIVTPIMFFAMAGYVFSAVLLCIWIDHIFYANR